MLFKSIVQHAKIDGGDQAIRFHCSDTTWGANIGALIGNKSVLVRLIIVPIVWLILLGLCYRCLNVCTF